MKGRQKDQGQIKGRGMTLKDPSTPPSSKCPPIQCAHSMGKCCTTHKCSQPFIPQAGTNTVLTFAHPSADLRGLVAHTFISDMWPQASRHARPK